MINFQLQLKRNRSLRCILDEKKTNCVKLYRSYVKRRLILNTALNYQICIADRIADKTADNAEPSSLNGLSK